MEGTADPPSPRRRSANASTVASVGLRWSAPAAERGRVCRSTRSASPWNAALEVGGFAQMPLMPERPFRATSAHDQADRDEGDHSLQVGAPGWGEVVYGDRVSTDVSVLAPTGKPTAMSWWSSGNRVSTPTSCRGCLSVVTRTRCRGRRCISIKTVELITELAVMRTSRHAQPDVVT